MVVDGDSTYCSACAEGTFSDAAGNEPCASCALFWADSYRTAGPVGATSADQCRCALGGFELLGEEGEEPKCRCPKGQNLVVAGDEASCVACTSGTFSDSFGNEVRPEGPVLAVSVKLASRPRSSARANA